MKKKLAFSLAEALITLLIVSLITIAATPVITKKARPKNDLMYWSVTNTYPDSIKPINNKNIVLGTSQNAKNTIIVTGILEFKNTKGETIGWISENGTSSFDCNCNNTQEFSTDEILENQRKIFELISMLQDMLSKNKSNSNVKQNKSNHNDEISEEQLQSYINDIIKNMNININQ